MDFKEMEYVIVIAQEKNISKAAERLYISQPALSRFLLKLEDSLGTELFQRKNRQYIPTYAGELYLEMARKILENKQKFESQLKEFMESGGGKISFGITPGRARTILPKIIPAFHEAFPNHELNVLEEDVETLERYLGEGKIEIAFFTIGKNRSDIQTKLQYKLISREEIVLCTAKESGYRLLASEQSGRKYPWLNLQCLEKETFLLLKENMRLGQFAQSILAENRMQPRIMRLSSIDTVLALAGQEYGAAFASSFRIEEHESAKNLDLFSIGDEITEWDFVAAFPKGYKIRRPVQYLIDQMRFLAE